VVIDAATNQPVAHARVVVSVHFAKFLALRHHYYGLIADENGAFSVAAEAPFDIHYSLVEASAPGDLYDRVKVSGRPVELRLKPLPKELQRFHWTHYKNFTGEDHVSTFDGEMEFLDEGWEIRTATEVETGYPPVPRNTQENHLPSAGAKPPK
jgi:hypothetical protein